MPRVSPIQSNFNSGQFSPMLQGRVDAERYKSGLALCYNAIPALQGPAFRRSGDVYVANSVTNTANASIIIPFKYSNTQSYILEFSDLQVNFFTDREQLVSGMAAYTIVSPYKVADLAKLKWTQSLDTLYLVNPSYPPYKLLRFGSVDWSFQQIQFKDGPYLNQGTDPSICQVTSLVHTCQVQISTAPIGIISTKCGDYAALAVANLSNNGAGAIRVTFADPDEFGDRSWVYFYGATGTTNANSTWQLKKIDSLNYDMINSVFNAAYTGGCKFAPGIFSIALTVGSVSVEAGRMFRLTTALGTTPWNWGIITATSVNAFGGGSSAAIELFPPNNIALTTPTPNFQMGSWSTLLGYPSCAGFHDDRLYLGGADGALQRMDGSNTSDYENFQPTEYDDTGTIIDSNAVAFSLTSNDANAITAFTSDEYGIPVLTSGGPFVIRPSSLNEAITPVNVSVKRVDNVGAADALPVYAGKSTIYLSLSKRKIYELTYYYNIDGFRKIDLTEIAENLPDIGISTNIVFQSSPQPVLWCGRADGTFLGMTFDRNLDVLRTGWSTHKMGGVGDASGNPPVVEMFAVIPAPDGTVDDVWCIVRRYINGSVVRYIEYFNKFFEEFDDQSDAFMVDAGATFDSPITFTTITNAFPPIISKTAHGLSNGDSVRFDSVIGLEDADQNSLINGPQFEITVIDADHFYLTGQDFSAASAYISGGVYRKQITTVSGLTWLKNETVQLLGDGRPLNDAVVNSSGQVTLSSSSGKVQIGLGYKSRIQQLRLEAGAADGTSIGKRRRINETAIMLNRSGDFKFGINFDQMSPHAFRQAGDPVDQATPLFTGIVEKLQIESDYDTENMLCFEVDTPTPFMLTAIMPQQTTYDKG